MSVKVVSCLSILAIFFAVVNIAAAVEVECPIIADTMFSGHEAEHNTNCGGQTWLRCKNFQGIVVFRFDMSKLEGYKVFGATLSAYCISPQGEDIVTSKISTIAHDWIEGTGSYTVTAESSTYDYPGGDLGEEWAEEDNDGEGRNGVQITVQDVINGLGGSIINSVGAVICKPNEWINFELDEELVQGLVDGEQYGIAIWQDGWGNLDFSSKERNEGEDAAELVVQSSGADVQPTDKLASTWGKLKSIR